VTVQVTQGQAPRIIAFTANPTTITQGQSSTLTWNVENADTVDISGLGTVPAQGSQAVTPNATATFVLTARNRFGFVQSNAPITVNPQEPGTGPGPTLTACTASPATSPSPGTAVSIAYTATNATSVAFAPAVSGVTVAGPVTVNPVATTTYTITATGAGNRTATCTVTVTVTPAPELPPPVVVGGTEQETLSRQIILDASGSTDPAGGALTFFWEPLSTGAAVLDQGSARTRVQFAGPFGTYLFRVTVRNAIGQSASTTVTVHFRATSPLE
jgi:hypothetical protein